MILHRKTFEEVVYIIKKLPNGRLHARIYIEDTYLTVQLPIVEGYKEHVEIPTLCDTIVLTHEELDQLET